MAPFLVLKPPLPDLTSHYQTMIAAQTACQAAGGTFSQDACIMPPPPPPPPPPAPVYSYSDYSGTLTGSYGYSLWGGNCVDLAKAYGKDQPGNPISWYATTQTPFIGAAALFPYNHVGIITGLWSNGDLEIAQENAGGAPHRYSPGEFRGFF